MRRGNHRLGAVRRVDVKEGHSLYGFHMLSFFFFFLNLFIMVPVNTTDQCELYYEPGTSLDTYDISELQ